MFEGTIAGRDSPRALGRLLEDRYVRLKQAHQQENWHVREHRFVLERLSIFEMSLAIMSLRLLSVPRRPHFLGTGTMLSENSPMKRLLKNHSLEYVFTKTEPKKTTATPYFALFHELRV
jgi:hypothetical protein